MTGFRRLPLDQDAYLARVRAACFVCETVAGRPGYEHDIAHRDDDVIVFLAKWPWAVGHLLVAPVDHRESVVSDFTVDEYLRLQRIVHAAGRAVSEVVATERLYVLSLGSEQGNRHVHWHLAPLPPGVPYAEQQVVFLAAERGYLDVPPAVQAGLAAEIGARMREVL